MKLAGLQERIAKWEDLHTDCKERFDSNRELAKDIVCFDIQDFEVLLTIPRQKVSRLAAV